MRFLSVLFFFVCSVPVIAQNGWTTLDQLQIKHFNSKKKYPATVLRNDPEAFYDIASVVVLKGKNSFTGIVVDSGSSAIVRMEVSSGYVIDLLHLEPNDERREHYAYHGSEDAGFHAADTVWYGDAIFQTSRFYDDTAGIRYLTQIDYNNGWETHRNFRVGYPNRESTTYHEPIEVGVSSTYYHGELFSSETYHNGHIDGEVRYYDYRKRLLQKYYVNPAVGLYGSYYEYDTSAQTITTGVYNARGFESGIWTSKYTDSTLAAMIWMNGQGSYDSAKTFDHQGRLLSVNYSYWRLSRDHEHKELIRYTRSWYPNGQLASWNNYDSLLSDTLCALYSVSGKPTLVEYSVHHRIATKTWYENGKPRSERYGIPCGSTGSTLRDSIYREWSPDGILQKEHFYVQGRFISSNDAPRSAMMNEPDRTRVAYYALMKSSSLVMIWDTSLTVPSAVIDEVATGLNQIVTICNQSNDKTLRVDAMDALQQNFDMTNGPAVVPDTFRYYLRLNRQKNVTLDSSGHITTGNTALDAFLDSLHVHAGHISRGGEKKRLSTYWVYCTTTDKYLNLLYANRRLAVLAPGSEMSAYRAATNETAPEIIFLPADTGNATGISAVTRIAVAGKGRMTGSPATQRTDTRSFFVFNVYGDGEVEFSHVCTRNELIAPEGSSAR